MDGGRKRILIVSAGSYGQKYLEEITGRDVGGDAAAVVDVAADLEKRFPVLREKGIPVFRTLDGFFASGSADLAVISSPIHLHGEMVRECLDRGLDVLCEKPLCLTEEETLALAERARKAGRFLALGWQLNYDRAVLALRRDILSGRFGRPLWAGCLHAMRRGKKYYDRASWAGRITADGREVLDSPFMNACAHHFQLMTFLLGDREGRPAMPLECEGELYRGNPAVENYDTAALRFRMDCGIPMMYWTAHPIRTRNLGQSGVIGFEEATVTWGRGKPFRAVTKDGAETVYGLDGDTDPMRKLYDCVALCGTGDAPLCGPGAGLGHLKAVRLAQKLPIRPIPADRTEILEEGGDRFVCVRGLEELFLACMEQRALPGELGRSLA